MRLEVPESLQLREQTMRASLASTESELDREPESVSRHLASRKENATGRTVANRANDWTFHTTLEEFIGLLRAYAVSRVVDVRTVPRSRHNPQFNKDSLPDSLKQAGLRYVRMLGLGGLRHAKRDSLNLGWRNTSFRGYADYMHPGICGEPQRIDPVGQPRPDRINVRRSGAMALPSFAHRSCRNTG
jgi:Protein of unknown function, DUF488